MKKTLSVLCMGLVIVLLAAGCGGGKKSQEDSTKGKLRGNVSALINESPSKNIHKARVSLSGTELFSDTDSSGNYLISNISPGTYDVTFDFSSATNVGEYFALWGDYKLNGGEAKFADDVAGDAPSFSVSDVTIAAGVTTTLDFILYGY